MSPILQELRKNEDKLHRPTKVRRENSELIVALLIVAITMLLGLLFSPTIVDAWF